MNNFFEVLKNKISTFCICADSFKNLAALLLSVLLVFRVQLMRPLMSAEHSSGRLKGLCHEMNNFFEGPKNQKPDQYFLIYSPIVFKKFSCLVTGALSFISYQSPANEPLMSA
jgi:hypothetical protein